MAATAQHGLLRERSWRLRLDSTSERVLSGPHWPVIPWMSSASRLHQLRCVHFHLFSNSDYPICPGRYVGPVRDTDPRHFKPREALIYVALVLQIEMSCSFIKEQNSRFPWRRPPD